MESLLDEIVDLFDVITQEFSVKSRNSENYNDNSVHNWFHKDEFDLTISSNFKIVCDTVVERLEIRMISFSNRFAIFEISGITYTLTFIEVSGGFRVYVDLILPEDLNEYLLYVFLLELIPLMPLVSLILYAS